MLSLRYLIVEDIQKTNDVMAAVNSESGHVTEGGGRCFDSSACDVKGNRKTVGSRWLFFSGSGGGRPASFRTTLLLLLIVTITIVVVVTRRNPMSDVVTQRGDPFSVIAPKDRSRATTAAAFSSMPLVASVLPWRPMSAVVRPDGDDTTDGVVTEVERRTQQRRRRRRDEQNKGTPRSGGLVEETRRHQLLLPFILPPSAGDGRGVVDHDEGFFRIVHFTDLHYGEDARLDDLTTRFQHMVLDVLGGGRQGGKKEKGGGRGRDTNGGVVLAAAAGANNVVVPEAVNHLKWLRCRRGRRFPPGRRRHHGHHRGTTRQLGDDDDEKDPHPTDEREAGGIGGGVDLVVYGGDQISQYDHGAPRPEDDDDDDDDDRDAAGVHPPRPQRCFAHRRRAPLAARRDEMIKPTNRSRRRHVEEADIDRVERCWAAAIAPAVQRGIPFASLGGNHDDGAYASVTDLLKRECRTIAPKSATGATYSDHHQFAASPPPPRCLTSPTGRTTLINIARPSAFSTPPPAHQRTERRSPRPERMGGKDGERHPGGRDANTSAASVVVDVQLVLLQSVSHEWDQWYYKGFGTVPDADVSALEQQLAGGGGGSSSRLLRIAFVHVPLPAAMNLVGPQLQARGRLPPRPPRRITAGAPSRSWPQWFGDAREPLCCQLESVPSTQRLQRWLLGDALGTSGGDGDTGGPTVAAAAERGSSSSEVEAHPHRRDLPRRDGRRFGRSAMADIVLSGHDHGNDYWFRAVAPPTGDGLRDDVVILAQGRKSGFGGYAGGLIPGARVLDLSIGPRRRRREVRRPNASSSSVSSPPSVSDDDEGGGAGEDDFLPEEHRGEQWVVGDFDIRVTSYILEAIVAQPAVSPGINAHIHRNKSPQLPSLIPDLLGIQRVWQQSYDVLGAASKEQFILRASSSSINSSSSVPQRDGCSSYPMNNKDKEDDDAAPMEQTRGDMKARRGLSPWTLLASQSECCGTIDRRAVLLAGGACLLLLATVVAVIPMLILVTALVQRRVPPLGP